jgi:hypothetical protein
MTFPGGEVVTLLRDRRGGHALELSGLSGMAVSNARALQLASTPGKDAAARDLTVLDAGSQKMRQVGFEPTTFGFEVRDSIR